MSRDAVVTSVAMVSLEVEALVPFSVTEPGLNVQVLYVGRPEHAKLTAWLKPPTGVSVRFEAVEAP